MPVSKKYKGNINHRKKRGSRKLKRAGQRQPLMSYVNIKGQQFIHSQNYEITRDAVSGIIGKTNIDAWNNELKDPNFKNELTYNVKENPKDMVQYFPYAMYNVRNENIQNYDGLIEDEKSWIQFYAKNTNGEVIIEDNYYVFLNKRHENIKKLEEKIKKLEEKKNLEYESLETLLKNAVSLNLPTKSKYEDLVNENGEFINENVNIHGLLIKEFRRKFGIMVGSDEEVKEDRDLYVKSIIWAYGFNPLTYIPKSDKIGSSSAYNLFRGVIKYDTQEKYDEEKQKIIDYLARQYRPDDPKNSKIDLKQRNQVLKNWRNTHMGPLKNSKAWYNPYNNSRPKSSASAEVAGGRKTRKRRKIKKRKGRKSRKVSKKNA